MTLNSVDWETEIIIKEGNNIRTVKIGEYIDNEISENKTTIRLEDDKENEMGDTYYLDTKDKEIYVPSVNEDADISWKKVEALTKHLPINSDRTSTLIKVKTRMRRTVSATKAKSFLLRKDNKLVATRGDELEVGDFLPLMTKMPKCDHNNFLDMTPWFPKTKYIYGSEIEKAKEYRDNIRKVSGRKNVHWFENESIFTVPYTRSDSLSLVIDGIKNSEIINGKLVSYVKDGYIYPYPASSSKSGLPEKLELDEITGFFFGAILAEGCITNNYVSIANNDESYRNKISEFAVKLGTGYHVQEQYNKIQEGWTSIDIRLHNVLLARWLPKIMGKLSHGKYVPNFAYNAPDDFVMGLLNGYFSGDGCVSGRCISATSASEKLIDGIMLLLTRFGILSTKSKPNNRGTKEENIHQLWILTICNKNIRRFSESVGLIISKKQTRLDVIKNNFFNENSRCDKIPGINLKCLHKIHINKKKRPQEYRDFKHGVVRRIRLKELLKKNIDEEERIIINKTLESHIHYDDIISIEDVSPSKQYVYDLTVEGTRNFCLANLLMSSDTFHSAGQRANVSLSFHMYKELINGSKVPKNSNMTIYFEEKKLSEEAMRFGFQNIEYHELRDFASVKILDTKNEVVPEWYRFSLAYTPQYSSIIPNREELIRLLSRNKVVRNQILKKLRIHPK